MVQAGGQNCCQITTGTIALAFSHVSIHSRVYPIGKRISSDKQDISSDIFFFEFNLHDVCTSSVRTSGCMISNCIFLVVQVALLAQRLEVYAPHGVLNSLSITPAGQLLLLAPVSPSESIGSRFWAVGKKEGDPAPRYV